MTHCIDCNCASPFTHKHTHTHTRSVKTTLIPLNKPAEISDSLGNEERRNKIVIRIFCYHKCKLFTSFKMRLSRFISFSAKKKQFLLTCYLDEFNFICIVNVILFVRHIYVSQFLGWAGQPTLKLKNERPSDVTCYFLHFLCAQHFSDINISIFRSLRLCCWITTLVVLFSFQRNENKTTDVVIQQHSRKLLKMDILMSEKCWAHKKWKK